MREFENYLQQLLLEATVRGNSHEIELVRDIPNKYDESKRKGDTQ